jgi:mannonate dehydratase
MSPNTYALKTVPGYYSSYPGLQIATQMSGDPTEEDFQFVNQLGVEWAMTGVDDPNGHTVENYKALKAKFESHGIKIYRLANHACHNMEQVTLNLPGRDEKVAEYLNYIRTMGAAGIHYSTYAHMGNGIWSSGREAGRGGVMARAFHLGQNEAGFWIKQEFHGELTHGREYTEQELWDNYEYFIKKVVPVAEAANVYIGIHPDDPPVYKLGGIPRPIFGTFEGYRQAIEIANSPNVGMCLCVGCWLEGGELMGRNVVDTIRYFGGIGKLFKIHLRNVTAPIDKGGFMETFLDNGYMDMHQVVRALREVDFDGAIISDHLPAMIGGRRAAEAWSIGYIKAMVQAVNNEFKR